MEKAIFNKEAKFNYEILEELEAGIVLKGDEIKAIRSGRVSLAGSYGKIFYTRDKPELFLVGSHFYSNSLDPYRSKKLLIHKIEIKRLIGKTKERGLTLIPLMLYLKNGKAKIKIGIGKGKKLHDKRASLKEKELNRKIHQVMKGQR